jgi:Domain of unknown function (DUF4908)
MMFKQFESGGSQALVMALTVTAVSLSAVPALALDPVGLRGSLFSARPEAPAQVVGQQPIARFVSQEGETFVLDRSQARPLMKFDDSPEVWVLRPQMAPRGDVIYMNDLDEPVLRATRLGGLTLFTPGRPGGSAAALSGAGSALRLGQLGPQQLLERLAQASSRASRAARRLIPFEADASPSSSALTADAAMVAAEAVIRMTHRADGKSLLAHVARVELTEGRKAAAHSDQGVMRIVVAPADGLAGRPSSDRIIAAAGGR